MQKSKRTAPQATTRNIQSKDEEHKAAERDIWRAQIRSAKLLNWITAIGTIVGILGLLGVGASFLVSKKAADAAAIQAKAAQIANRPWVPPDVTLISDILLYYRKDAPNVLTQISIPIRFQFKNIGRTATSFATGLVSIMIFPNSLEEISSAQHQMCDETTVSDNPGQSVFPDQIVPLDVAIIDFIGPIDLTPYPGINNISTGRNFLKDTKIIDGHRVMDGIVFGCVIYKFSTDDEFGKSYFAYRLLRRNQSDQKTGILVTLSGTSIAKDELILEPVGFGGVFSVK